MRTLNCDGPVIGGQRVPLVGAVVRRRLAGALPSNRALARCEALCHAKVVKLLHRTLDEESAADRKLTGIAQSEVLDAAKEAEFAEAGEESEEA